MWELDVVDKLFIASRFHFLSHWYLGSGRHGQGDTYAVFIYFVSRLVVSCATASAVVCGFRLRLRLRLFFALVHAISYTVPWPSLIAEDGIIIVTPALLCVLFLSALAIYQSLIPESARRRLSAC